MVINRSLDNSFQRQFALSGFKRDFEKLNSDSLPLSGEYVKLLDNALTGVGYSSGRFGRTYRRVSNEGCRTEIFCVNQGGKDSYFDYTKITGFGSSTIHPTGVNEAHQFLYKHKVLRSSVKFLLGTAVLAGAAFGFEYFANQLQIISDESISEIYSATAFSAFLSACAGPIVFIGVDSFRCFDPLYTGKIKSVWSLEDVPFGSRTEAGYLQKYLDRKKGIQVERFCGSHDITRLENALEVTEDLVDIRDSE
ncbi:hypothetical protein HOA92_07210 [archaeon]|jgi:hypothetical protein|nr:hypothetical protein [archaeon]MBT6762801.1 hypothetical protein [archaeon]